VSVICLAPHCWRTNKRTYLD